MVEFINTDIGLLPKDWNIDTLENLVVENLNITYGVVQPGPEENNGILFIRGGDIKKGRISTGLRTISKSVSEKYSRTLLEGGELLVSLVGYPGECAIVPIDLRGANIARQVGIIRLKKTISKYYIQQYLSSSVGKKNLLGNLVGSAQQVINLNMLRKVKIPLPSFQEQQKIADILSTVDEKIEVINQQITETEELKKGVMQKLFTKGIGHTEFKDTLLGKIPKNWEVLNIDKIADVTAGGTPSTKIRKYWGGDIPWMNSGDINQRRVKAVEGRITEKGLINSSTKLIPINSVLMALAGQGKTRGKVAINEIEVCTNQSLATLYNFKNADHEYIFQNLESRYTEIRKMSTGDGGRGGLNLKIIKSIKIALPPIREQRQISKIFESIDNKFEVLRQKKVMYSDLKRGLMQQLLTGQIRVNNLIET